METKSLIQCKSISYFEKLFPDLTEHDQIFFDYRNSLVTIRSESQLRIFEVIEDQVQEINKLNLNIT